MTAACPQRWALFLGAQDHMIWYKGTTQHGNAVELPPLPCELKENSISEDSAEIFPPDREGELAWHQYEKNNQETGREKNDGAGWPAT